MRLVRFFAAGFAGLTGLIGLAGCQADRAPTEPSASGGPTFAVASPGSPKTFIVLGSGDKLPANFSQLVQKLGGAVRATLPKIGIAIVGSASPTFKDQAKALPGVQDIAEDMVVRWIPRGDRAEEFTAEQAAAVGPHADGIADDERFFPIQWAPKAIRAPEAWATGARGEGARVAIIDGGLYANHLDLRDNVDVAHSASFVDGQPFDADVGTFWHGTHVAGIVAAEDNGVGTIGIAPAATIIGVKALHDGIGSFASVIQAIYYAATPIAEGGAGADIVNLSLGADFDREGNEAALLAVALGRATTYAYQQGVTVFASAGNGDENGVPFDLDHTNNLIILPAMSPHVLAISALGPEGFALGATNFDRLASYSNFGQSAIEFGAPGGDFALPGNALCVMPIVGGSTLNFCWVFDMVLSTARGSTANGGYFFAAGTSMASPAAAGVAALIIGKYGRIGPAQVEARLRASADDLGKPGNDDAYGKGRVNAFRAAQ